jgi:hypothetical protein
MERGFDVPTNCHPAQSGLSRAWSGEDSVWLDGDSPPPPVGKDEPPGSSRGFADVIEQRPFWFALNGILTDAKDVGVFEDAKD